MMIKESCNLTGWQDLGEFSFYVLPAKSRDKILWKLEKFRLGPIFGLFLPILGQIRIFWKIHYCNFFLLLGFCHCAKLQSTLKNRFDKKTWRRDGGTRLANINSYGLPFGGPKLRKRKQVSYAGQKSLRHDLYDNLEIETWLGYQFEGKNSTGDITGAVS